MNLSSMLNPTSSPPKSPLEKNETSKATNALTSRDGAQTTELGAAEALTTLAKENADSPSDVYAHHSLPYVEPHNLHGARGQNISLDTSNVPPPSTTSDVKSEEISTPSLQTPDNPGNLDDATLKAIAAAQNEYGTRVRQARKQSDTGPMSPVDEMPPKPAPVPAKKRRAPKNATKKSDPSATAKPPSKKRKIDGDGADPSTPSARLGTPNSTSNKPLKAAPGNRKHSMSATPIGSSPAPREDSVAPSEDGSDDGGIYCICRKPDNHTWMIGCDGGCEDWFHGKCVNISQKDEDLIDKYICPNCETEGRGVTTWKPMCRNDGCRKPARLKKGSESKYCSNECGIAFMKDTLRRAGEAHPSKGSKHRSAVNDEESEPDLGPLGGPIRKSELNALANAVPSVEIFKELGSTQVLTPPASASPHSPTKLSTTEPIYPTADQIRLDQIIDRKDVLRQRRALLKDRERFVVMAKERSTRAAEKLKVKETCGYDSRLSWDDKTFKQWRDSPHGQACFQQGTLDPTEDATMVNGDASSAGNVDLSDICSRKRCERHRTWQKLALQNTRFEEADVGDEMRRIDREERDIRERAAIQAKMHIAGYEDEEGGTVESVDVDMS